MSSFTRLSALVWEWPRLTALDFVARAFWVLLYTAPHARKGVPGIWHGSVSSMADAARMEIDEASRCVDLLIDKELVEYDPRHRVLRLMELHDAGEWPSNPNIMLSWWKRFQDVPECGVRDAHVQTIRWMLDRGARDAANNVSRKPTAKHEDIWAQTFGTVTIPVTRRRGVRRLADFYNDTSTEVQGGLFAVPIPSAPSKLPPSDSEQPFQTDINPQDDAGSVDCADLNKISTPETLSKGSGEGEGEGEGAISDLSSLRGGSGEISTAHTRPVLTLVPPPPLPGAFTVADLDTVLRRTGSRWPHMLSQRDHDALEHAIGELGTMFDGPAVIELLREHIARGGLAGITPSEICRPGALSAAIEQAQARKRNADERAAMLAAALEAVK